MPDILQPHQFARAKFGTTAARPTTGPKGLLYYDTDVNLLYYWTGSAWTLVNACDDRLGYYVDANAGTVFNHEFVEGGGENCLYQLMGDIQERSTGANNLRCRLNQSGDTAYEFIQLSHNGFISISNQTAWGLVSLGANELFQFCYNVGYSYAHGHISGNGASTLNTDSILIKGSFDGGGGMTHIRIYTDVEAVGHIWLRKLDW